MSAANRPGPTPSDDVEPSCSRKDCTAPGGLCADDPGNGWAMCKKWQRAQPDKGSQPQRCPNCNTWLPIDDHLAFNGVKWQMWCECGLYGPKSDTRAGAIAQWNMLSMTSASDDRPLPTAQTTRASAGSPLVVHCAGATWQGSHVPTPEDLRSNSFAEVSRVHDWRNYVSDPLRGRWQRLSDETLLAVWICAEEQAAHEDWD